MFSAALPPASTASVRAALGVIKDEPERRERLWDNTRRLMSGLVELGFDIGDLSMMWLPHHPATRKKNLLRPTLGNRVLVLWKPAGIRSLVSVPARSAGWRHAAAVVTDAARRRGHRASCR